MWALSTLIITSLVRLFVCFVIFLCHVCFFFLSLLGGVKEKVPGVTSVAAHVSTVETVEGSSGCEDEKAGGRRVDDPDMAPDFTAGDASARLLLPAEEQPHTLSITVSTDSRTTSTQVANRSLSDSNSVTPPGPIPCANPEDLVDATLDALRRLEGRGNEGMLRLLMEDVVHSRTFSSGSYEDDPGSIMPCWGRDDVVWGRSTCSVATTPPLHVSPVALFKAILRDRELGDKYKCDRNPRWLLRTLHILDHLIAVSQSHDVLLGHLLSKQAVSFSSLFDCTRDIFVLDNSITDLQVALSLLPPKTPRPGRHELTCLLGFGLNDRYDMKRDRKDLDQAITAYREALEWWPRDQGRPIELVDKLGIALRKRCEVGGDVSDVESAIRGYEEVLPLLGGDHPMRPFIQASLGAALRIRCEMMGDIADVEHAIGHFKHALAFADCQNRPTALNSLGAAFGTRYKLSGKASDLEDAIRHLQDALFLRSSDHPDRPDCLIALSTALYSRYLKTRDPPDLQQAICYVEEAISIIDHGHALRWQFLNNLSSMLCDRYEISKKGADLDNAILLQEQVLSSLPTSSPERPGTLANFAIRLLSRFHESGDRSYAKRAMDCFEEALALTSKNTPYRQLPLFNFLLTLSFLYSLETLPTTTVTLFRDRCIELAELITPQHPEYSKTMWLIAPHVPIFVERKLDTRKLFLAIGIDADSPTEDAVLALLEKGSKASASPSIERLDAICEWITFCHRIDRPCSLEMYASMFDQLDLSVARGCSVQTRRQQLSGDGVMQHAKRLVSEAVAFALEQGATETAVEFLERGQSILLTQLSRYRPSAVVETLRPLRPDLATRFDELSRQVECATFTEGQNLQETGPRCPLEDPVTRSNRLKADWDCVVQEIRAVEGFHHFLLPTPFPVLQQAAAEGPVILVNISKSRSDAIVVTSDRPPIVVPLDFARPEQIEERLVSPFRNITKHRSDPIVTNALKALWDFIVEPVVEVLQDTLELPKNLRIWWCPTNPIMSLPLHAAGRYPRVKECLPYLYISSYTSTLSALIRTRGSTPHRSCSPSIVLVGQPSTPGQNSLPQVKEEIRRIKKRNPDSTVIMHDQATHDVVLSAVVQHQWVHLSCHGLIHRDDPLQSHFALYDSPLTLLELMQQRLPIAELAFLSACYSAADGSEIPNEFLHLTAGMQFAGFKSVVGTMWAMLDDAGPALVDEFYRRMLPKDVTADYTKSARALNAATRKLKDRFPMWVWINFVHWGA